MMSAKIEDTFDFKLLWESWIACNVGSPECLVMSFIGELSRIVLTDRPLLAILSLLGSENDSTCLICYVITNV